MKLPGRSAVFAIAVSGLGIGAAAGAADLSQFADVKAERPAAGSRFVPRSVDTAPTQVVVLFSGDSVASAQKTLGRKMTQSERDSVIAARSADHQAVAHEIQRRGGEVLGSYHSALNGVKVKIARNRVGTLRSIPGVVDIKAVGIYQRDNATSVPLIGAPQAWQLPAHLQGQGVKIAILDTGIDYTHANFGGPGTPAAFTAAAATSTLPADPALFGPGAPKVKGGTDLVGDAYDAAAAAGSPALIPQPDPNPLDCNGHGSHVAGTAAGYGVKSDGTTFHGPYGTAAYTPGAFTIGPGVAPMADLYSVRVFGCSGSTGVVADAIDWAVANGMDVISMSLGSNFGAGDNAEAVAVANANAAGIVVVAASGNAGAVPYITSSPASIDGAVSVAATDAAAGYPTASLGLTGGASVLAQDSNGATFASGSSYPVVVLRNANGTVSFGCSEAEYDKTRNGGIDITGKIVVAVRGSTCARVFRAGAGQHYGAAAVALINNGAGYPPYEGPIPGGDPTTNPYEPVTIPFFGVLASDTANLTGPTGGPAPAFAVATSAGILANAGYLKAASFSSGGPRFGDSALRPAITAPGVATVSTGIGTGNGFLVESGTSMATPHVAGVAALVKQANKSWSGADLRSALVESASPTLMRDYSPRLEGAGLVQALAAVTTQAVVRTPNDSLSYGYVDLLSDLGQQRQVTVHNDAPKAVQFNISVTPVVGPAAATVTVPPSVIVPAKGDAVVPVTLSVPAASVGGTHDPVTGACCLFEEVGGYLRFTPSNSRLNGNVALTVPYYLVAHTRSNLDTAASSVFGLPAGPNNLVVTNSGALAGTPDFYALGLQASAPQGVQFADTRAVGVQAFPTTTAGQPDVGLVFAVNTFDRFSNAAGYLEWDILIDTTGTGVANYVLVGYNGSSFTSSASAQNKLVGALIRMSDNAIISLRLADVATDNSTLLMLIKASEIGLTAASPRFTYWENHFDQNGNSASMPGSATFNAYTPALTFSGGGTAAPGASVSATVGINAAEWALSPALGLMIVAPDNAAGASQARLVPAH